MQIPDSNALLSLTDKKVIYSYKLRQGMIKHSRYLRIHRARIHPSPGTTY